MAPPESAVGHDNAAIGAGGRVTLEYAISLARSGVSRDCVARALLARTVHPDHVREIVAQAFTVAGSRARSRGLRLVVAGVATALCGGAMQFAVESSSEGAYWSPLGVTAVLVGLGTAAPGVKGMGTRRRVWGACGR